jgi:hypothetical protein
LVAGDDKGNLIFVLDGKKVFYIKQLFGHTITFLEYQIDQLGYPSIIAADETGVIASFSMYLFQNNCDVTIILIRCIF